MAQMKMTKKEKQAYVLGKIVGSKQKAKRPARRKSYRR